MPITRTRLAGHRSRRAPGLQTRRPRFNILWISFVATLGVGLGVAVIGSFSTLATVLVYVGVALFLSLGLNPLVELLARRGPSRGLVVLALSLGALIAAILGVALLIPSVTTQLASLGSQFASFGAELSQQTWVTWLAAQTSSLFNLESALGEITKFVSDPEKLLRLGNGLLAVGTGLVDAITGVIIVTVLTVYFTITLPAIKANAYLLVPRSRRDRVIELTEEITQSVGKYVGGQLILACCNATITFIVCAAAGNPAPAVVAILAFVGALIPVVGPVIGVSIAVLTTLPIGGVATIIVAAVLLVYLQVEAYVLTPRVMARAVAVPGGLVIVAALAGAALGGILGALVAVPVAAAGIIIFTRVVVPHQAER